MEEVITLRLLRHEKKKWSFQGGEQSRVEIAVLEYFRYHGWKGYFTEHRNYFALCVLIIGWAMFLEKCEYNKKKDRSKYFSEKRKIIAYGAAAIFENCRDGWLPMHEFSYEDVYAYFCAYDKENFGDDLKEFMQESINSFDVGKFHLSAGNSKEINYDEVVSFFERFSLSRILKYIDRNHPIELVLAKKRLNEFDKKYREWHMPIRGCKFEDFSYNFRNCVDPISVQNSAGMHFLFQPAFHFGGGFEDNITKVRNFSQYIVCPSTQSEVLEECDFAEGWRNRLLNLRETTTLDLQIWKSDRDMIVEVKAPNDRLSAAQLNTIKKCRDEGGLATLVKVEELAL